MHDGFRSSPGFRSTAAATMAALLLNAVAPVLAPAQQGPVRGRPAPARPPAQSPAARDATTTRRGPGDTIPRAPGDTVPQRESRPDSLYDALLRLRGYTPVEYQGDSAEIRAGTRVLRLRGDAQVSREGTRLTAADSIVYRERSRFVEAYGQPTVTGQGEDITGNVMFYDLTSKRASVQGARTRVTDQVTWLVEGDVSTEAQTRVYASNSTFTSDDREVPAYHFRADQVKIIRNRILVGRPAVLYFRNVPVMALPFIVHDLEQGRRSGLLIPRFELNDIIRTNSRGASQRGTGRQLSNIGYYWAINEYLGAQLSAGWRSGTYRSLAGDVDFNWRRQFLRGSGSFEQFWREEGTNSFNLRANGGWKPDERTDLTLSANYAKSSQFERERTVDPRRANQDLSSNFSGNRRFDWGTVTLSSERRQSLANGDVNMTLPNFGLTFNPITLFPSADPTRASLFNDMVLTLGLSGSRQSTTYGEALRTRQQGNEVTTLQSSPSLRIRNLTLGTGFSFNRSVRDALGAIDSLDTLEPFPRSRLGAIPGSDIGRVSWNASTSYQINLIGSTYVSPSISLSRDWVRQDSVIPDIYAPDAPIRGAYGRYVGGPMRLNFGAAANADVYGFFPGVGPYSAIRHHFKPTVSYRFSPAVQPTEVQRFAFGNAAADPVNEIQLNFDNTFEAKRRETPRERSDTLARDTTAGGSGGEAQADPTPADARKVTMLSVTTSALAFSFVRPDTTAGDLTRRRFRTDDITNTIRSDYFGGLNFSMGHDLFQEQADIRGRVTGRSFSPYLTSLSTSFQLGQNSALLRFLGLARNPDDAQAARDTMARDTAAQNTRAPIVPRGGGRTATANPQEVGGGPWNLSLRYSLQRARPPAADSLRRAFDRGNQDLSGTLSFYPTKNWGVSWTTSYSITDRQFHQHSLNFTRDLYRWAANIDFYRTATGNTAFTFRVSLTDLPDLKFDYRESELGIDRPTETRRRDQF